MAKHNQVGRKAEDLAASHLEGLGYHILHRNWRYGHREVDIIAVYQSKLKIIEVKALSAPAIRHPEQAVNRKKFLSIARVAKEFIYGHPQYRDVEFQVLAVYFNVDSTAEYTLIRDVFL
jgi:putative endonuclease